MNILLLGGTGAMGNYLIDLLSETTHNVTVTTRSKREPFGNIQFLEGNAKYITFLREILTQHWDAIIDFMVYNTEEFKERADILLGATDQYIFLSSSRVYANSAKSIEEHFPRLLDESTDQEFIATDEYSLTKARQENILFDSAKSNWTIIRPYITFGDYRLQLGILEKEDWLYRALKERTIVFSTDINKKLTTMTHGLDVAKGIVSVIGNKEALKEAFHITNSKPIKWSNILDIYLNAIEKSIGKRPKFLLIDLNNFHKLHNAKYQINYDRMYDRTFNISKIGKFIDVDDFGDIKERLTECMELFLKNPKFKNINWRTEALKDRSTREIAKLSEITGIKQKINYLLYRFVIK